MTPKRDMKTPVRSASGRLADRSSTKGKPLSRPLTRTVTTIHHKRNSSAAAASSPRYVQLSAHSNEPQYNATGDRVHLHRSNPVLHQRVIPNERSSGTGLRLPALADSSTPEKVKEVLDTIIDHFKRWSDQSIFQAPTSFFDDIKIINDRLQFTALPANVLSRADVRHTTNILRNAYAEFVSIWGPATQTAVSKRLSELQVQLHHCPGALQESAFTSFIAEAQSVSPYPMLMGVPVTATEEIPILLSADDARNSMSRCDELHGQFQDVTYRSEMRSLWLLIWRGVKAAFMISEVERLTELEDYGSIELLFFARPSVTSELRRLIQLPDAANPRSIENMVGQYCHFVEKCRADTSGEYFHLRQLRDQPLKSHVLSSLRRFTETRVLETNTLAKLHFAVIRLNALNGGPTIFRRWRQGKDNRDWVMSPSYPLSPVASQSSTTSRKNSGQKETLPSKEAVQKPAPWTKEPLQGAFPYPQGLNMRCHYDYVYCPFPETRAHEVAQSEQITRDLADAGVLSEGLRPEYLINRPPPHTRDPAGLSVFTSNRVRLGPFAWFASIMQQLFPRKGRRHHTRGMLHSHLVRRKATLTKHPREPNHVLDPNSRVTKPKVRTQALRLRGGAGGPNLQKPSSPTTPTMPGSNAFQRRHVELFRQELTRRHGDLYQPSGNQILRILEMTAYDVMTAVSLYQPRTHPPPWQGPGPLGANNTNAVVENIMDHITDSDGTEDCHGCEGSNNHGPPETRRRPLGELVGGRGVSSGGNDDDENHGQDENEREDQPWIPPSSRQTSILSDQENLNPVADNVLGESRAQLHCHPCPWYKGHIHHNCQCDPNNIAWENRPTVDEDRTEDFIPDQANGQDDWNSNQNPQQAQDDQPARRRGLRSSPARTVVHVQDGVVVRNLYPQGCGFHQALKDIGMPITDLGLLVLGEDPKLDTNETAGHDAEAALERLRMQTNHLRTAYLAPLDAATPLMLDQLHPNDRRRGEEHPEARLTLVRQTWHEVEEQRSRLLNMLTEAHDRTNLSLRLKLNRFIRLICDLHCLVKEFTEPLSESVNSSDSQEFLSEDEQRRLANYTPRRRRSSLPTQEDYERMLKEELEREIVIEREHEFNPGVKPDKAQMVRSLMLLDRKGIRGAGAQHHYRILLNRPNATRRPRRFNLDKAVEAYKKRQAEEKMAARVAQRRVRMQRRREGGLSTTRGLTRPPAGQGPFTDRYDDLSDDNEEEISESESTASEE